MSYIDMLAKALIELNVKILSGAEFPDVAPVIAKKYNVVYNDLKIAYDNCDMLCN
jgi:hypothetical protein